MPMISLVCKYIDVFAERDSDVGKMSLVFDEINTANTRQLHLFTRRLPYGAVLQAVVNKI